MDNLPEDTKEIVNIASDVDIIKVETEFAEIKLESHNEVNLQPKGTAFGVKVAKEENDSITPSLTFDTKKLKEENKNINSEELIDTAIEEYLNQIS